MYKRLYNSPIGALMVEYDDEAVTGIAFNGEGSEVGPDNAVISQCVSELDAYFSSKLKVFTVPLRLEGTDFRKGIWTALTTIPYGQTVSYGELAAMTGNPKAARAVGGANHHNPVPIIVPCHRVIGANGSLTGFGGGLDKKEWLLAHERGNI